MLKTNLVITYKIFSTKNHYRYVKYNDFRYNCILASLHLSSTSFTDLSIWKTKSSKWEIVLFTHNLSPIIALLHQFDLELQGKKKVCKNRANGKKLFAFFTIKIIQVMKRNKLFLINIIPFQWNKTNIVPLIYFIVDSKNILTLIPNNILRCTKELVTCKRKGTWKYRTFFFYKVHNITAMKRWKMSSFFRLRIE